jgi:hypothetical protein
MSALMTVSGLTMTSAVRQAVQTRDSQSPEPAIYLHKP